MTYFWFLISNAVSLLLGFYIGYRYGKLHGIAYLRVCIGMIVAKHNLDLLEEATYLADNKDSIHEQVSAIVKADK